MAKVFVIEDERHAEYVGTFTDRDEAMAELQRLAAVRWDEPPNVAPCTDWARCGRRYELIEYDTSEHPWRERSRRLSLEISAAEVRWR